MATTRSPSSQHPERPLLVAGLTCCVALLLGLTAAATAGAAATLRTGLGAAGLLLLGGRLTCGNVCPAAAVASRTFTVVSRARVAQMWSRAIVECFEVATADGPGDRYHRTGPR